MGTILIILLRLITPILVLKWPLKGYGIAFIIDALDMKVIQWLNFPPLHHYQTIDKWLDMYLLFFAYLSSLSWKNMIAKHTSIFLFWYRVIGVIFFSWYQARSVLVLFPNLMEAFFVSYLLFKKLFKTDPIPTRAHLFAFLFMLAIPKFFHEYLMHYGKMQYWKWFGLNL